MTSLVSPTQQITTKLVTDSSQKQVPTSRRLTDAHRALTRGLAQYLQTLQPPFVSDDGRPFDLKQVFDDWAEPSTRARSATAPTAASTTLRA